jgi:parvulin-like peptidyl-prolyl isomerase
MRQILVPLLVIACSTCVAQAQTTPSGAQQQVFAIVGNSRIAVAEYEDALSRAKRQRFFHRQAPEAEVAALQRDVADMLVNRILLLEEVKRRGMHPDQQKIKDAVAAYEQRYASSPQWQSTRGEMIPKLTRELGERDVLARLEAEVRNVMLPDESALRQFYLEQSAQFTEPEQTQVSVILLRVDPSSPRATWDKAREEAAAIRERALRGTEFADLAKLHSGDQRADSGGDMGYLHRGMLPEQVELELAKLAAGAVSAPMTMLEGVALFRVGARRPAKLRTYDEVKGRVAQLWRRGQGENAWKTFIATLRKDVPIKLDVERYPALGVGIAGVGTHGRL